VTATRTLRIGTRKSALARTQSQQAIAALDVPSELVPITTHGDTSTAPLAALSPARAPSGGGTADGAGTGVFVSALREALLAGEIDVAVHSFKDLPSVPAEGIVVAAVPPREDPRDALVSRDGRALDQLPRGARIGTGSPRRAAQLRALDRELGLGLDVVAIRGNVDTRLGKLDSGELDALVIAWAGLRRLGRGDVATEVLDPARMLPAPAQGALAVECRSTDASVRAVLGRLEHTGTRCAVTAERALLAELEAGCSAPIGALAQLAKGDRGAELFLQANVTALDGSAAVRRYATAPAADADETGRRLAAALLDAGAAALMNPNHSTDNDTAATRTRGPIEESSP
jgi:hydroxymethylbilane synthase